MATDGGAAEKDMIWTLKRIWRAVYKAVKMPLFRVHGSAWDCNNHAHICLAARLLEPDDFHVVCPYAKPGFVIEHEDECDECGFFATVFFDTSMESGARSVSIYSKGGWCP